MPKLIINATGDQFFLPDSSQFYFDDLPGVKYLRYIPNTDHSLGGSDAAQTIEACYQAVLAKAPLPQFSWTLQSSNSIRVVAEGSPIAVNLWRATNPTARDFRFERIGPAWQSSPLTSQGEGVYVGTVPVPAQGWTGFLVELIYPGSGVPPYKFTTPVYVVPDVLPYHVTPPVLMFAILPRLRNIFYFRPGHETYPTYYNPLIRQVIANAARWAGSNGRPRARERQAA